MKVLDVSCFETEGDIEVEREHEACVYKLFWFARTSRSCVSTAYSPAAPTGHTSVIIYLLWFS